MISVIVPVFQGEKYIHVILNMLGNAAKNVNEHIELILVNDDPNSVISSNIVSDFIDVRVYNTEINRGIHGARVLGLKLAQGEYIHFLDQDDYIDSCFYKEMLKDIEYCDAVICGCREKGKSYYNDNRLISDAAELSCIIERGNCIKSPGQVLIKREAIPDIWTENTLINNGADDLFLWLLMISRKKILSCNEKVMFEHIIHENNKSSDFISLCKSEKEMIRILREKQVFDDDTVNQLDDRMDKNVYVRLASMQRRQRIMKWLMYFMSLESKGVSLSQFAAEDDIAIYGAGEVGRYIAEQLKRNGKKLIGYIDREHYNLVDGTIVKTPPDIFSNIDCIIVSLTKDYDSVVDELKKYYDAKIYTLEDIYVFFEKLVKDKNGI